MKKVLIITYYWPPSGGISVQRIVKFAKYLPSLGWTPIILTVDKKNYFQEDSSYLRDVEHITTIYRAKAFEPHSLYNAIKPEKKHNSDKPAGKISINPLSKWINLIADFIRLNFFIPDARIGWYPNAKRTGLRVISEEKPDLILSTAPPFTTHLVAKSLHKKTGLPWIADFRDAWLENNLYHKTYRLFPARIINKFLEKSVLRQANEVVCIGKNMKQLLAAKTANSHHNKFHIITNGYDLEDVETREITADKFYLSYFGTIYKERLPKMFLSKLNQAIQDNNDFKSNFRFRIFGNVDQAGREILEQYIPVENLELKKPLAYTDFMQELQVPQLLLLTIDDVPFNEIIITGKLFDYLTSANPILGLGPAEGDAAEILNESNAGRMHNYNDPQTIDYILEKYDLWKTGNIKSGKNNFSQFERKNLTKQLVNIFDQLSTSQN